MHTRREHHPLGRVVSATMQNLGFPGGGWGGGMARQ